ncbi:fibronectin type III domain-containing protein [Ditylenchus destructor]|nr:fibronectin type III domain-containing protein [Ditylenchus destructor]
MDKMWLIRVTVLLISLCVWGSSHAQRLVDDASAAERVISLESSLQLQNVMRELRRMKRATPRPGTPVVLEATGGTEHNISTGENGGRCVISADQAVHFCGFAEEVNVPPIPPPEAGHCRKSQVSGREICYPHFEELDTTCTDTTESSLSGLVAPPVIPHATVRTMAFVPPDNLERLIRQYYRQLGKPLHKNESALDTDRAKSFLFVKYQCEYGYEMVDEIDTMFCKDKQWILTSPVCRGKGLCEQENGGCSHSCLSFEDRTVECRCPKGMVLASDGKTCEKPIPKNLCRKLAGCTCASITPNAQYSCTCPREEKCLLLYGAPKIYLEPSPPYQVEPGGNLNITCAAVAFPFPEIYWQRENEEVNDSPQRPGAIKSEQVLMIKEIYKNTEFTCHARNDIESTKRIINVVVAGPGSAPILKAINAGRTSFEAQWDPPHVLNRPVTSYTVYYTTNGQEPLKNWQKLEIDEPQRQATVKDLKPDTSYTLRIRANDNLGPGKLSNPVSVNTQKPAKRPSIFIPEGEELRVPPKQSFTIGCNVTRGDPIPSVQWESKGRAISTPRESRFITLQHVGLYENTDFLCVAENEAGRSTKKIKVLITGPTQPERIRYHVDGDKVILQWEDPRIPNAPMVDYEVIYTDDPSLPEDQWLRARSGGPDAKSITLPDLKEKTEYTFKVRGHNENGVGLPSMDFAVTTWLADRKPEATLTPSEPIREAPSTQELVIQCEANGVPKPKIIWFWNGMPVEDGKDDFRIYDVTPIDAQDRTQSKLIAQSTTRSGVAKCEAVNEQGVDEGSVDVKVLGPGSPPDDIRTKTVQNGFEVSWKPPKIPNGDVTKYVIYYTKDPDADLADWSTKTVDGEERTAVIGDQEEDTPYVIRMQAITDDGPGIISDSYEVTTGQKHIPLTVKLIILEPTVAEPETVVEPRQPIRFHCISEGRPKPSVFYTWLPLNDTESGQEPVYMVVNQLGDPTEHRYITVDTESSTSTKRKLLCEARNIHGSASDSQTFNVIKPGSPPAEISPIVDLDNRVTISWDPPIHPNGEVKKYKVYLTADSSKPLEQWQTFEVAALPEPKIEFTRGELEPETPYYIRILAENDHGEGVPSDITHFVTVSGAPLDAPTDILVKVALDNTVNISWTGPSQPNGPIKSYTVYFIPEDPAERDDNYKRWPRVEVPTTADTGFVSLDKDRYNILPEHDYRVRISATNDLSEGPASGVVRFTTESGEIAPTITLDPPTNPASIPPLTHYTVNCTTTGVPPPAVHWTIGTNGDRIPGPILNLRDLVKDTTATCHAENNAGKVQEVLQILVAGPGTPPNEIVTIPMIGEAVNVEWTAPDEPNGPITHYILHYGKVMDGELEPKEWESVEVSPDQVRHKLDKLDPKSTYLVKVQAASDRGPGVISDPFKVVTLPIAPKLPDRLPEVVVHDNNTIVVEFDTADDPEVPGKKITDYKILYTTGDPQLEDTKWNELVYVLPADDQPTATVPIDGENFTPDTRYTVKVIPKGEIEGLPSDPAIFQTGDGIIAPDKPLINVDAEDNIIRVPAGADYTVSCTANGFPPPTIKWIDRDGNPISENGMLRVFDIKETKETICVAENAGGREETPFTIYVAGPGNAPENIRLSANRPKAIEVKWDPPTIPNGKIVRYIIYYTPLDDQTRAYQVGQVPSKPISQWMTYHAVGENLTEGEKHATLSDFVESDTAYAVVIQAANQDGPGPYSVQHSIRTMSKAREEPPRDLSVEPINQTSVEVRWKPADIIEEHPTGFEIFYVPADKPIEEDELLSLPKWTKVSVSDPYATSHRIFNELKPDTEYVFKIRAVYSTGPGVFSEPCITKTLPEGDAPYIVVSAGGRGITGHTDVDLLPGSAYNVFCRASGTPQPSVKWIRGGAIPIDPSIVESDDTGTRWSLNVANITEDTDFNCVAQNSLGVANWTIRLNVMPGFVERPDWKANMVEAENRNGDVDLVFSNQIPAYLKEPNSWHIFYTDDPSKPIDNWNREESAGRHLEKVHFDKKLEPGITYYVAVENPTDGIRSPVFTVLVPRPPMDIRVGSNINDEMIMDFRPALTSVPVQRYVVKYWPAAEDESQSKSIEIDGRNHTVGNVLPGLVRDVDYNFQVNAELTDGKWLMSDTTLIHTPAKEVKCDCSHACRLVPSDDAEKPTVECYCPEGFHLDDDEKTCLIDEGAEKEYTVVQVSPTLDDLTQQQRPEEVSHTTAPPSDIYSGPRTSPLPTDQYGNVITVQPSAAEEEARQVFPTDEMGRELRPIVWFNGTALPTDASFTAHDSQGRPIERNEDNEPLGPDGKVLRVNQKGEYVYPPVDKYGQVLPTDRTNFRPIYTVANADGIELTKNSDGMSLDENGNVFPTDESGQPVGVSGSPMPTDYYGRYVALDGHKTTPGQAPLPTDELGHVIYPVVFPNGEPLPTIESGVFVHPQPGEEVEIERDDQGVPLNEQGQPLPKNEFGQYVYSKPGEGAGGTLHEETRPTPLVIGARRPDDTLQQTTLEGQEVDEQLAGSVDGKVELRTTTTTPPTTTTPKPKPVVIVMGPDGLPLPTDSSGRVVDKAGSPYPTNYQGEMIGPDGSPLPTNAEGQYVVNDEVPTEEPGRALPTDDYGKVVYPVVNAETGRLLPTDATGRHVALDGQSIPTDDFGRPLTAEGGQILPTNERGEYIFRLPPTTPRPIVVIGPDGIPVPTDSQGRSVDHLGQPIPTNPGGLLVGPDGSPLPTDSQGHFMVGSEVTKDEVEGKAKTLPTDETGKMVPPVVNEQGRLMPTDDTGRYVDLDGESIPTDDFGRPVDAQGNILPTNRKGEFIYTRPPDKLLPTATTSKPPVVVIGPDGLPVPTDTSGRVIDKQGSPYPTNYQGELIGPDGSPLPTNAEGQFVVQDEAPTEEPGRMLPTDDYGKVVYPVIDADTGRPLPTDTSGRHVAIDTGEILPTDDFGRPLEKEGGQILPTNRYGHYIYTRPTVKPTTLTQPQSVAVGIPGEPRYEAGVTLPTDAGAEPPSDVAPSGDGVVAYPLLQYNGQHIKRALAALFANGKGRKRRNGRPGGYLDLAPDAVRVALLHYGRSVEVPVNLGGYHERNELIERLKDIQHNNALGIPDLSTAYSAAQQQFASFGRPKVARMVIVFTNGDDIFPNSKRHLLDALSASTILVGLNTYDAEIQGESHLHILLDDWSQMQANTIANYLEDRCQHGLIQLPTSRAVFVKQHAPDAILLGERGTTTIPLQLSPKCEELQKRTRIILAVETSLATTDSKGELQRVLLNFMRGYIEKLGTNSQVGIIYYGNTVEVAVDVGNYANNDELEEAVQDMHFVGGEPDATLAIKTAHQLFNEQDDIDEKKVIQLVFHVHQTPLSSQTRTEIDSVGQNEGIAVIDFPASKWKVLGESTPAFWANQLCQVATLVDRRLMEDTGVAVLPSSKQINDVFFTSGPDSSPLPTSESGRPLLVAAGEEVTEVSPVPTKPDKTTTARVLPTDEAGQMIYPVVGPDGQILKTDSSGRYVDHLGESIPTDDFGRPIGEDGQLLPVNREGQYVYSKEPDVGLLPTAKSKSRPVSVVIGPDGIPLPTDQYGNFVDRDNRPLPTNKDGLIVNPQSGEPLPTNAQGQVILGPVSELEDKGKALPTDDSGRFIYPLVYADTGKPVKTDESGRYIDADGEPIPIDDFGRPVDDEGRLLPTNKYGQYVYTSKPPKADTTPSPDTPKPTKKVVVIGPDGIPLATDYYGTYVDKDDRPLPTNIQGDYMGPDGSPLPTNAQGHYAIGRDGEEQRSRTLPTDESGRLIYPVVDADKGEPLPTDQSGRAVDPESGVSLPIDDEGRPLDKDDGELLPTNRHGEFIYKPPTTTPKPGVVVIGPDGLPLPTDSSGRVVDKAGSPYPTNYEGELIGPDGSPLPTNEEGHYVMPEEAPTEATGRTLPTDDYGKAIYPVVDADTSRPLPTDTSGRHVALDGEPIPIDDFGRPLDEEGKVLPTNRHGEYIYTGVTTTVGPPVGLVGPDGMPLPTDVYGRVVDKAGSPYPTNYQGKLIGPDGSPLPTDVYGQVVVPTEPEPTVGLEDEGTARTLPTDETGKYIYPVVDADGMLLPRNSEGRYMTAEGELIPVDDFGRPLDQETTPENEEEVPIGNILPTNDLGQYIYIPKQPLQTPAPPSDVSEEVTPEMTHAPTDTTVEPLDTEQDDGLVWLGGRRRNQSLHCFISSYIELLLVFDTSNNVKILDYRVMKEAVKLFLMDNFDLRPNRVRVGVLKYGDEVDVPVALGDYSTEGELLARIGETRRMKGDVANLDRALRETAGEFILSGNADDKAPRIVILWKNGNATGNIRNAAEILRHEMNVKIFVITVGGKNPEDVAIVGDNHPERVINLHQWRGLESSQLGSVADKICEAVPSAKTESRDHWPARKTTPGRKPPKPTEARACSVIDYEVDLVIAMDSSNFDQEQFDKLIEGVGTLVDESFDLAPDVVRIGFIVYSDKVSVPVALGHYEDKIELLSKITDSEKLFGNTAVALRGLEAAREQFQLHGRGEYVSKVILLITNGKHRGNAAPTAQDLRDLHGIQIFAVAVNPSPEQYSSLSRIVGLEHVEQRLLKIASVDELSTQSDRDQLSFIRQSLCARINPAPGQTTQQGRFGRTVKRDVDAVYRSHIMHSTSPAVILKEVSSTRTPRPVPLCKDGFLRPYLMTIIVDVTARAKPDDFQLVMSDLSAFINDKFGVNGEHMRLNLVTVNGLGVVHKQSEITAPEFVVLLKSTKQEKDKEHAAKLGVAIREAVELTNEQFISGDNRFILVVSADSLSSDPVADPVTYATDPYPHHVITVSIKNPVSDLLKNLSRGVATRVIHFGDWAGENVPDQFSRWLSYSMCESITATYNPLMMRTTKGTTRLPKWKKAKEHRSPSEPTSVVVTPISPNSVIVSWTCCTNNKMDYVVLYTPDDQLPKSRWHRVIGTCRDSFGLILRNLPTDTDYAACVISTFTDTHNNATYGEENCDKIYLSKDVVPVSEEPAQSCPPGHTLNSKSHNCVDVDECKNGNGGCSHGCVNAIGDYYCACPHGMMLDPVDPKKCIPVASSFDRITQLLARYLYANAKSDEKVTSEHIKTTDVAKDDMESKKLSKMKSTIQSKDEQHNLSFEWSTAMRKFTSWFA